MKERYGPENVQAVFVEVLRSSGFTRPDKWDTGKFGVGIVNAKAVLDATLPDAPPPRPKAAPQRTSSRERLEAVLGAEQAGEAEPELTRLFLAPPDRLDDEIDRLGDEVAYLLAENPGFLRHLSRDRGRKEEPGEEVEAVRALLASAGSPQLVGAVTSDADT